VFFSIFTGIWNPVGAGALVARDKGRGRAMLNASYYRKQADICTRLAQTAGSGDSAVRFKMLALEMLLRAEHASDDIEIATPTAGRGNLPAAHGSDDP
jgi:hypothetical protein